MRMNNGSNPGGRNHHQKQPHRQNGDQKHHHQNNGFHHDNSRPNSRHGPGRNHQVQNSHRLPLPKKNTVNFDPSHEPAQMRIIAAEPGLKK